MNLSGCIGRKPLFKSMHTCKDIYNRLKLVSMLPDRVSSVILGPDLRGALSSWRCVAAFLASSAQ